MDKNFAGVVINGANCDGINPIGMVAIDTGDCIQYFHVVPTCRHNPNAGEGSFKIINSNNNMTFETDDDNANGFINLFDDQMQIQGKWLEDDEGHLTDWFELIVLDHR